MVITLLYRLCWKISQNGEQNRFTVWGIWLVMPLSLNEVIDIIRQVRIPTVMGNYDMVLTGK